MFFFIGEQLLARSSRTEDKSSERRAFEHFLRTGRRLVPPPAAAPECKFNPYHDPRNGRFTFAPGGPKSLQNALFSDRRGLWKPKDKTPNASTAKMPSDVPEHAPGQGSNAGPGPQASVVGAASPAEVGPTTGEFQTSDIKIYLPVAPNARGPLLKIAATDEGAEYANCPVGGDCRETISVNPRNTDEIQLVLNTYRRSIRDHGWKDNDFDNLVDIRYALYVLMEREAIAAHLSDWDPTQLVPADWIAENIADLDRDDRENFTRTFAYYMTLGIDGPGPAPDLLLLESLMNPAEAAQAQTEWLKKSAIHRSYQGLFGPDPIFATTEPVDVHGARAIDRGTSYEEGIRRLYGGDPRTQPLRFTILLDGKVATGRADHVTEIDGRETAIDAKYTDGWMATLRNPLSAIGVMPWSEKEQRSMLEQAKRYTAAYDGGVLYHTNSFELAKFYSKMLDEAGINGYRFVITPSR